MGRTRENQGIYSLNSWEKGAAVSERRKAQLHSVVQYSKIYLKSYLLFEKFQCVNKLLEKGTIAQWGAIQDVLGKEKRTMCNYPGETLLLAT